MTYAVFSRFAVSVAVLLLAVPALAEETPAAAPDDAPVESLVVAKGPKAEDVPILMTLKRDAPSLEFDYVGRQYDADVWLITGDKIMQMVHVLPTGAAVIGGTLVSPDGRELSSALQKAFADANPDRAKVVLERVRKSLDAAEGDTKADEAEFEKKKADLKREHAAATGEMIWKRMNDLGVVRYGATADAPVVYAVVDPADAASKQAYETLLQKADAKAIDLRVVPITLSAPDVVMDIGLVLGAADPAAALRALMVTGHKPAQGAQPPKPDVMIALKNSADFIEALKLDRLPALFYRKSDADPIRVVKGAPKDWSPIFNELNVE